MLAAQFVAGAAWAEQAITSAGLAGDEKARIAASMLRAQARAHTGFPEEALADLEALSAPAAALGDDELTYEHAAAHAYVLRLNGRVSDSIPVLDRAVRLAENLGDSQEVLTMLSNRAIHLYELGRMAASHADALRAKALFGQLGDVDSVTAGVADIHLAVAAAPLGRLGEAVSALESALSCFERAQAPLWQRTAQLNLAQVYVTCGQFSRAEVLLAGDWSPARGIHRMGRMLQLARLARWQQRPAAALLSEAHDEGLRCGLPYATAIWNLEATHHQTAREAVTVLRDAQATLLRHEKVAFAQVAHGQICLRLHEIDPDAAIAEARTCWRNALDVQAADGQLVVWRACAQAFRQGGDRQRYGEVAAIFHRWLLAAVQPPLPPLFAQTLKERNPDLRALLAEFADHGEITAAS
jgi:tetratricopeptide (TPR) repeat protein